MGIKSTNPLSIVMYHYVRPILGSRFPGIKGLEVSAFEGQLDYLFKHYQILRPDEITKSIKEGTELPARAALLTFDDGYKDHIQYVLPSLLARGLKGVFFPPMAAIRDREILDVNRIHFILASVHDKELLVREVEAAILDAQEEFGLDSLADYRAALRASTRFDEADVVYLKRLLQNALPESLRTRISKCLFARYVSKDECAFGEELYLSGSELQEIANAGMEVGSHGDRHFWLGRSARDLQAIDIDRSLAFLGSLGLAKTDFWFCYPYGSYNMDTLELLKDRNCVAAVSTLVDIASCRSELALKLTRLDTNDLPRTGNSEPSIWTKKLDN